MILLFIIIDGEVWLEWWYWWWWLFHCDVLTWPSYDMKLYCSCWYYCIYSDSDWWLLLFRGRRYDDDIVGILYCILMSFSHSYILWWYIQYYDDDMLSLEVLTIIIEENLLSIDYSMYWWWGKVFYDVTLIESILWYDDDWYSIGYDLINDREAVLIERLTYAHDCGIPGGSHEIRCWVWLLRYVLCPLMICVTYCYWYDMTL